MFGIQIAQASESRVLTITEPRVERIITYEDGTIQIVLNDCTVETVKNNQIIAKETLDDSLSNILNYIDNELSKQLPDTIAEKSNFKQ